MTGYILGVGDYLVLNRDNTEGETKYVLNYHDETPLAVCKADVIRISNDWKMYDGENWIPFGGTESALSAYALSSDVVSGYTSLELFNQTVGNLESIISGI